MGGSAASTVGRVLEQARTTVEEASPKINNYVGDLTNDTGRTLAAGATLGASEEVRLAAGEGAAKMAEEAKRNAPDIKALPPPPDAAPATPAPGAPATIPDKAAKDYAPARGRASTILTGSHGLSGSPSTARRTLLGV